MDKYSKIILKDKYSKIILNKAIIYKDLFEFIQIK
jgi:hypothetical protein